jgi:hypothetical protein
MFVGKTPKHFDIPWERDASEYPPYSQQIPTSLMIHLPEYRRGELQRHTMIAILP